MLHISRYSKKSIVVITAAILVLLGGCTAHTQYRTQYAMCTVVDKKMPAICADSAIQEWHNKTGQRFIMSFTEFDDQGRLWSRSQMNATLNMLSTESVNKDLLMVVFVHGWKHNAKDHDGNIETFRHVLADLAKSESEISSLTGTPARQVVGMYMGWRGGSVPIPVIENLTFWDRKNTAEKVGHGDITEVLSRLEQFRLDKASTTHGITPTRLIVVGHSFGGLVVHTALSQILTNRFVGNVASAGVQSDIQGFGNLVVLINPAFEAQQFSTISDMSTERGFYPDSQLPVMVILTSEADTATGYAFPIARLFSTSFEKTRERMRYNAVTRQEEEISEWKANMKTVGHFKPYFTHSLYPVANKKSGADNNILQYAMMASSSWENDEPGSKIDFGSVTLERTKKSAAKNPYLNVYVDGDLISGHNDIDNPDVISFLKQLVLISTVTPQQKVKLYNTMNIK